MDLMLVCDCLAPLAILQSLRKAGIPAERREMRRLSTGCANDPGTDPLAGCGADFVVLLNGHRLIGIRRKSQDDAVSGILHSGDERPPPEGGGLLSDEGSIGTRCQLDMLKSFPLGLLVLEGRLSGKFACSEPAIYALQYWCFQNHLFVFHTPNIEGTAMMLEVLFRRTQISVHRPEPARDAGRDI